MACSVPIYYLLHRIMADGSEGMLMEPDMASLLTDAVAAEREGSWRAVRVTLGRDTVLEGHALRDAIEEHAAR